MLLFDTFQKGEGNIPRMSKRIKCILLKFTIDFFINTTYNKNVAMPHLCENKSVLFSPLKRKACAEKQELKKRKFYAVK